MLKRIYACLFFTTKGKIRPMSTQNIRSRFLSYFQSKGHVVSPSAPVVPQGDHTLLFCNAGMNPFKDVFLGKVQPAHTRVTSSQKCIRAGGKHNDLDQVGHTARHLTFFEMLGNFSFGSYFKKEAIDFAWDVSLSVFGLDPHRIWASVLEEDEEAFSFWTKYLPANRVVRMGRKDNFWSMGDTGPCGPCSELLYDRGERWGDASSPLDDERGDRFLEFWNLVFMQYERDQEGNEVPLEAPCIDTGGGLERILMLVEEKDSVFETDILGHLIRRIESLSGREYSPECRIPFQVVADHVRSVAFMVADGAPPSNTDRGYVVRKLIRRAVRYGRMLGLDQPFLSTLLPVLEDHMGGLYPELRSPIIAESVREEEEQFLRTLKRGGSLLNAIMERTQICIRGKDAFRLKDTYGLPFDEILTIAHEAGLEVDEEGYRQCMEAARELARSKSSFKKQGIPTISPATHFTGHDLLSDDGQLLEMFRDGEAVSQLSAGEKGILVVDQTPFYAESGGQEGDRGDIVCRQSVAQVGECARLPGGVIAHHVEVREGKFEIGDRVLLQVDSFRRGRISSYHTATHLLHEALRQVLGSPTTPVQQAGSLVSDDHLRFDFSYGRSLSKEQIVEVETLVNRYIDRKLEVRTSLEEYEDVRDDSSIRQFFGEKYGEKVRVVDTGISRELCGGTHVAHLGKIGPFLILEESALGRGVRRMIAVVGRDIVPSYRQKVEKLEMQRDTEKEERAYSVKVSKKAEQTLLHLLGEEYARELNHQWIVKEIGQLPSVRHLAPLIEQMYLSTQRFQAPCDSPCDSPCSPSCGYFCMGVIVGYHNKNHFHIAVRTSKNGLHAGKLVKEILSQKKGKGGGGDTFAQCSIEATKEEGRLLLEQYPLSFSSAENERSV